jgi:hypothetical protein
MSRAGRQRKSKPVSLASSPRPAQNGPDLAVDTVDDPLERGAKLVVVRNVAEHPLTYLKAKGRLDGMSSLPRRDRDGIAEIRFEAGSRFRTYYERAGIGGARAIDYGRVKVDGGVMQDPLSEQVQDAYDWLNGVAHKDCKVGALGYAVLVAICGDGLTIAKAAEKFASWTGLGGRSGQGWVSCRLIEALDALAEHLKLTPRPGKVHPFESSIRADREMTIPGPGIEWEIGRASDGSIGMVAKRPPAGAIAAAMA